MSARLYDALMGALLRHRTFILEWFLALEAICCGLWIIAPTQTFTGASVLKDVPEPLTGTLFLAFGTIGIWVQLRENVPKKARSQANLDFCRRWALASSGFWTLIVTSYLLARGTVLAVPMMIGFVLGSLWVYFRLYLRFKRA
ncbi:MAG: hypothetical protein AB7I13_00390 [Vicinamibacterales bacterium]